MPLTPTPVCLFLEQPILGAKYVGNKMLWKFCNISVWLGNMLSKKTAKSSTDTFLCYVGNGFGMPKAYSRPLLGATVTPNLVP